MHEQIQGRGGPIEKKTRKSCKETNMKAALRYRQSAISNLILISKYFSRLILYYRFSYYEFMQHLRDKEEKQLKMTVSRPFGILFLQNLSWVILV